MPAVLSHEVMPKGLGMCEALQRALSVFVVLTQPPRSCLSRMYADKNVGSATRGSAPGYLMSRYLCQIVWS